MFGLEDDLYCSIDALNEKIAELEAEVVQHFEYGEPTNITRSLGWLILKTKQAKEKSNDTK